MSHSLADVRRAAVRAQVMLVMPSPPSKGGARVGEASQSQSQFRPDVCFRFGQVGVATGAVDWVGTCGNVSSAVARFAAEEGLGTPLPEHAGGASRMTRVRMLCQNTGAHVIADVGGVADPACELVSIPGVSGAAPPVWLRYQSPAGALTGKGRLLPSGEACDWLEVDGLRLQASLVDCTTGVVLLRAVDVGLNAEHNPPAMLPVASGALLERLEAARRAGAEAMGLDPNTPSVPKVGVVSGAPPGSGAHLSASFLSMGQPHKAIPLTAAMALAAAAFEGKSIVAEACSGLQQPQRAQQAQSVVIATPAGNVDVQVETTEQGAVACVSVLRTARRLADCVVYPP